MFFNIKSNKFGYVFQKKISFCENCMCELLWRMECFTAFNGEIFSGKTSCGLHRSIT